MMQGMEIIIQKQQTKKSLALNDDGAMCRYRVCLVFEKRSQQSQRQARVDKQ